MSTARGDVYLLIVDVTVCKDTPVILHGEVSPEIFFSKPLRDGRQKITLVHTLGMMNQRPATIPI